MSDAARLLDSFHADSIHRFLSEFCDNRATQPNGMTHVALTLAAEIERLTRELAEERDATSALNGSVHELGQQLETAERRIAEVLEAVQQIEEILGGAGGLHSDDYNRYCGRRAYKIAAAIRSSGEKADV